MYIFVTSLLVFVGLFVILRAAYKLGFAEGELKGIERATEVAKEVFERYERRT